MMWDLQTTLDQLSPCNERLTQLRRSLLQSSMSIAPLPYPEQTSSTLMFPKLLLTSHKIISYVQCLLNISIYFCFIKGENPD